MSKRTCGEDRAGEMEDEKLLNKILPVATSVICRDEEFIKIKLVTVWGLFDENEKENTH